MLVFGGVHEIFHKYYNVDLREIWGSVEKSIGLIRLDESYIHISCSLKHKQSVYVPM